MQVVVAQLIILSPINAQDFPNDTWAFNEHPEQSGWDADKIKTFRKYISDSTKITGLVIVHKGKIIFNYGDNPRFKNILIVQNPI